MTCTHFLPLYDQRDTFKVDLIFRLPICMDQGSSVAFKVSIHGSVVRNILYALLTIDLRKSCSSHVH